MLNSKKILLLIGALLSVFAYPCFAALSIDDVVNPMGMTSVALSPDGKHIAMVGYTGFNHGVIMMDAETQQAKLIIIGGRVTEGYWVFNKDPQKVLWVNNDLLAVDYGIEAESVTRDGKKVADLGASVIRKVDPDNPDSPLIFAHTDWDSEKVALVNAQSGDKKTFHFPMSGTATNWVFDSHGVLRALTLHNSAFWKDVTTVSNWYRASETAEWEKLAEFKVSENYWTPLSIPEKENTLVILSSIGRDTKAVLSYNTRTHEIGELLAGHPTQDILGVTGTEETEFKSVVTNGMMPQRFWFDDAWNRIQFSVDAALPKRINVLTGDPKNRILVSSYADVDPGRWFLLDVANTKMREIAARKPGLDINQMRPMEVINYPSGDGLSIPAYLTRPAGEKRALPTVVMIHGGPIARDAWQWEPDVQLLASNGYAVFQPQFRGSYGFGRKFQEAGYGQWGLSMQDDITAGVQYLIKQGIADPKRICIYGASYGGYAALWGMVKTPELYRCGISFAGVSDIELMFNGDSDANKNKIGRQLMHEYIGDEKLNKAQFDQVSPLQHADRIRGPILLMHGDADQRVPISHTEKMIEALQKNHKTFEWKTFKGEGHGLKFIRNEYKMYDTMLKFLNKYIGPPPEIVAPPTPSEISDATK